MALRISSPLFVGRTQELAAFERLMKRAVDGDGAALTVAGEAGIAQFLDVGSGLPAVDNTHEVAQRIIPSARVVYADNDPLVITHARALLASTAEGATGYLQADIRDRSEGMALVDVDGAKRRIDRVLRLVIRPAIYGERQALTVEDDPVMGYVLVGAIIRHINLLLVLFGLMGGGIFYSWRLSWQMLRNLEV